MTRYFIITQLCLACLVAESLPKVNHAAQSEAPENDVLAAIIPQLQKEGLNPANLRRLKAGGHLTDFVGGTYLFVNASEMAVSGKIGGQDFELQPGQQTLIQPKDTHAGGACQVSLSYQEGENWRLFRSTRWSTNKRYRSLVFFHEHPVKKQLTVSPIVDLIMPGRQAADTQAIDHDVEEPAQE